MAVDHPSSAANPTRKRERPSKMELKMSLVAKRLSMLQDDSDLQPVAAEVPRQYESESIKKEVENRNNGLLSDDDEQVKSFSAKQKICGSTKLVKDISDDSSSEDIVIPKSSANQTEHGRNKKLSIISDDESSEDRELVSIVPRKKISQRRDWSYDLSQNMNSSAMKRANEVQAKLSPKDPSFVKLMSRSHVTQGFWLGLPKKFSDKHLPECDCTLVLVDENGKQCNTKYLAYKSGLSAGWREFAITRDLHEGDVVVFHLISPTTFKVYIVREDNLGEVDGALGLLNLDAFAPQWTSEDHADQKTIKTEDIPISLEDNTQNITSDVDLDSEVVDGIRFSDTPITFEATKTFKSFSIVINGLVIDSKFTDNVRKKYYELCYSQGGFLHEHLLKGLNCNLVVGIISEVVNIADATKAYRACSSYDNLHVWEQTLQGFELLGMNVSFLCKRLELLLGISSECDMIDESRFKEARVEQARAVEKMKGLEMKLSGLKEMMMKIDSEVEAEIQASARKHERIKEIVSSPW